VAHRRPGLGLGLVAVAMAASLALLSGCSDGGSAPRTLPPVSTTPAAATSTAPPTSKAADLAAVKAVVRRYYQLVNRLHSEMPADAFASLMTPTCVCREQVAAIRQAVSKHQRYIDTATVISITPALESKTTADALVQYDAGAGGLVNSQGRRLTSAPPRHGLRRLFHLRLVAGVWLIDDIQNVS